MAPANAPPRVLTIRFLSVDIPEINWNYIYLHLAFWGPHLNNASSGSAVRGQFLIACCSLELYALATKVTIIVSDQGLQQAYVA